jgi:arylsulfatase A-like enzyme
MSTDQPNIIFIVTDDQGWEDLGCFGSSACFGRFPVKTPVLDKLASEGVRLTSFYAASPVCSPSRVGFMTGQYPARNGIDYALHGHKAGDDALNQAHFLDPKAPTITRALKNAGYTTAHFGKWHMGGQHDQQEMAGLPHIIDFGVEHSATGNDIFAPGEVAERHNSSTAIVNRSIEFLEGRDPSKPFYMNVWFNDPHGILDPTPEQMEEFDYLATHPNDPDPARDPGALQVYYSVIADIDRQVGRLLDKLDELGLADNTLVIFTSDNGPAPVWDPGTANSGAGRTGPFRGVKASLYEGGVRMPFIARWPGHTPKDCVDNESIVSGTDLLPTFCKLAGVEPPAGLDGQDMSAVLEGVSVERQEPVFWEYRFGAWGRHIQISLRYAMRKGKWKLMTNADGTACELFDLSSDLSETANCAKYEPEIVESMLQELMTWARGLPSWGKSDYEAMRTYPWPEPGWSGVPVHEP